MAMDYTLFMLSAAKERYETHADPEHAMIGSMRTSGRVVLSAAAVMIAVFLTFALSGPLAPKEMGVILAIAVALDAFVVRLVLLPVLLRLGRHHSWHRPAWLGRILPRGELLALTVDGKITGQPSKVPSYGTLATLGSPGHQSLRGWSRGPKEHLAGRYSNQWTLADGTRTGNWQQLPGTSSTFTEPPSLAMPSIGDHALAVVRPGFVTQGPSSPA